MTYYLVKLKGYDAWDERVNDFKSFKSLKRAKIYIRNKLWCRKCRYDDEYSKCRCGTYSIHKVVEKFIKKGKSGNV